MPSNPPADENDTGVLHNLYSENPPEKGFRPYNGCGNMILRLRTRIIRGTKVVPQIVARCHPFYLIMVLTIVVMIVLMLAVTEMRVKMHYIIRQDGREKQDENCIETEALAREHGEECLEVVKLYPWRRSKKMSFLLLQLHL